MASAAFVAPVAAVVAVDDSVLVETAHAIVAVGASDATDAVVADDDLVTL